MLAVARAGQALRASRRTVAISPMQASAAATLSSWPLLSSRARRCVSTFRASWATLSRASGVASLLDVGYSMAAPWRATIPS
jgi:hypothetical protein